MTAQAAWDGIDIAMRLLVIAILPLWLACGDNAGPSGLFNSVPLTEEITDAGLSAKVDLVRDKYGIAHIYAKTADDAAFAQGFVMAHDRLTQMDLLRRFGAGTLSEMFGALEASLIDTDIQMRVHRMRPLAEESFAIMQASADPTDQAVVRSLQRFADGVNTYAKQLADTDRWSLDAAVSATFDIKAFVPWSPIDSLVLGRFQAFSLSFSVELELTLSELYQKLQQVYDGPVAGQPAEVAARRFISEDFLRLAPVGRTATIDGFPNVSSDSGTRSDAGRTRSRGGAKAEAETKAAAKAIAAAVRALQRPLVPAEVFAGARTMFPSTFRTGALGALGPQAFMAPRAGSNNWAMAPSKTGGKTLLGTDQHLQLSNPSIFYPIHLVIENDTEVLGVSFPGIPGVLLGSNGKVAWSGTVANHDVNDIYLETVSKCGARDCVLFNGAQVPIETRDEIIKVGLLGNIMSQRTVTLENVPHHGPILPTVIGGAVIARTGTTALSVRYTGYSPSFEIRAIWDLMRAKDMDQAFTALRNFSYGGQNWTMIDNSGNIGWTSNVAIPVRAVSATTWNATSNPQGNAPWFILPGDGSAEWEGMLSSRYVPHAINPATGYLATANSDPVGQTFDNDALNQPEVSGRPLYVGMAYAPGVRLERISSLLEGAMARGPVTLADFATIQHDTRSTVGSKLAPKLTEALAFVADSSAAPVGVADYLASLPSAKRDQLTAARALLAGWSYATAAAVSPQSSSAEINDSAATSLFNTWMHFFIAQTLDDELARTGVEFERSRIDDSRLIRIIYGLLVEPSTMKQSATTQQPILCDRMDVGGEDDSCTEMQLRAMMSALDHLASPAGYGSAAPTSWRWGAKHRTVLAPLFPNPALTLPDASDGAALRDGFPRAGDTFVINRADAGWNDLNFAQSSDGAAQRFLAEAEPGKKIKVKWQLPGGTIFDSRSPHYRDLLDNYYLKEVHFDAPFEPNEVLAASEERWSFR